MVQPISSPLLRAVKKERALYLETARQVFPQLSTQLIKMATKKVNITKKKKGLFKRVVLSEGKEERPA